jgi:hypothetical protein
LVVTVAGALLVEGGGAFGLAEVFFPVADGIVVERFVLGGDACNGSAVDIQIAESGIGDLAQVIIIVETVLFGRGWRSEVLTPQAAAHFVIAVLDARERRAIAGFDPTHVHGPAKSVVAAVGVAGIADGLARCVFVAEGDAGLGHGERNEAACAHPGKLAEWAGIARQCHARQTAEPIIGGVGGTVAHGDDFVRRVGGGQASSLIGGAVRIAVADLGSASCHRATVALRVFNELVEGVVAEGDLVDDGAGADGGVVVAADLAKLTTIGVFQRDAADSAVDAGAQDSRTVLGDTAQFIQDVGVFGAVGVFAEGDAALLVVGVSDLAGDLADGVDIERVDFGLEQVGAGNTIGGEGGAVLPSGDLVARVGVGDDEAGKAAIGGVVVLGDAGGGLITRRVTATFGVFDEFDSSAEVVVLPAGAGAVGGDGFVGLAVACVGSAGDQDGAGGFRDGCQPWGRSMRGETAA